VVLILLDSLSSVISDLLDQELKIYEDLRLQVDREILAIDEGDMDRLVSILEEKQSIISRQEEILSRWEDVSTSLGIDQKRETPLFWSKLLEVIGRDSYEKLVDKVERLKDMASLNLSSENIAQEKMKDKLKDLKSKMNRMANGKKAVKGYMGNF